MYDNTAHSINVLREAGIERDLFVLATDHCLWDHGEDCTDPEHREGLLIAPDGYSGETAIVARGSARRVGKGVYEEVRPIE